MFKLKRARFAYLSFYKKLFFCLSEKLFSGNTAFFLPLKKLIIFSSHSTYFWSSMLALSKHSLGEHHEHNPFCALPFFRRPLFQSEVKL